jgi:hypothetical protein
MPEANREPISGTASSRGTRNFDGLNSKVLGLAGYGLLAYALYNLIASFLIGGLGAGPEIILNRMTQVLALYPLLLLGPALIFAPHRASQLRSLGPNLVRWLVLLLALIYLLFVPVALLNQFALVQRDNNQIKREEVTLDRRRQEILRAIEPLQSADAFRSTLSRFPEITSLTIAPGETTTSIRAAIRTGVNQAIQQEISRLRQTLQQRRKALRTTALSVSFGSLIAGLTLLGLASYLLPWLAPLGHSVSNTFSGLTNAFEKIMRRLPKARLQPRPRPRSRRPGRR